MEGSSTNAIVTAIQPFTTALTSAITLSDVVAILASVIGLGVTLYLGWFGIRKAISVVKKGLHGKFGI